MGRILRVGPMPFHEAAMTLWDKRTTGRFSHRKSFVAQAKAQQLMMMMAIANAWR